MADIQVKINPPNSKSQLRKTGNLQVYRDGPDEIKEQGQEHSCLMYLICKVRENEILFLETGA